VRLLTYLLLSACAAPLWCPAVGAGEQSHRDPAAAAPINAPATLSRQQRRAVGIVIAAAPAASLPQRLQAYGEVLDPSQLVADVGRLDASRAAARAAGAEMTRLTGLYRAANTSLKALQGAEAAEAEAQARAREAQAQFLLRWGPLARLGAAARATLIQQLAAARQLLLRADLPGRHILGTMPGRALVDVDGIEVVARVLGPLPQAAAGMQSIGLLLQMPQPPAGLGPGARLPVMLEGGEHGGYLVPAGAVLYGQSGAFVYRVLPGTNNTGDLRFAPLAVRLLQPAGRGWLVTGLHHDERIVVQGAGVLWSLQGLGPAAAGDDD
jgi:hypothetical protein